MRYFKNVLINFNKQAFLLVLMIFTLIQSNGQGKQKCFKDDGLKYQTVITINFLSAMKVSGTVTSAEYGSNIKEKTDFTGTVNGKILKIKFEGKPPRIGAATQWTDKPWIIKKNKDKEMLCIVFDSKSYDTKKWSNATYEFAPCP